MQEMPVRTAAAVTDRRQGKRGMHRLLHLRLTGPRHAAPLLIVVVLVGMFLTSCAENGRTAMTDRVVDGATADSPNLVGDSAGGQAAESAVEEPGTIVQEGATVIAPLKIRL